MRKIFFVLSLTVMFIAVNVASAQMAAKEEPWNLKASYIEACSCELFCPCYFNTHPDKEFCKFNMGVKIEKGNYGKVKLDGMKVWIAGDLGGDWSKGEMKTAIFTFEPSATQEQVNAAMKVFPQIYPAKWGSVVASDRAPIEWKIGGKTATAKLGDGTNGSVDLAVVTGNDGKTPVVIKNLTYWGAKKNNGFVMAKSKHHYKGHDLDYSFEDANGFLIDIESSGGGK
ncbi:MAG: DUF1326 domain-containing protein [Ignavibacteriae bacterium]|nr:DUF1326 domain-containing protein [Ignavibacteriota bacterium]